MSIQGKRIDDFIIDQVSKEMGEDRKLVETVHNFEFKFIKQGLKKGSTINVSRLGCFKVIPRRAKLMIEKLEKILPFTTNETALKNINEDIEFLKHKRDERLKNFTGASWRIE